MNVISWLQAVDTALFRWVNQSLANKVFDWLMPQLAGHPLFLPALLAAGAVLLCKGGRQGRVFVLCLALAVGVADGVVTNKIKKLVARPRPCIALADARVLIGCSDSGSMPSAHAANWFAAAMVGYIFYRRSWRVMLPAAATIAFSRVYNGVHYPSDVVAGAIVGAGSAVGVVWWANALWGLIGRKWFPLWWQKLPSLVEGPRARDEGRVESRETRKPTPDTSATGQAALDAHWLRLGYILIVALLLFRLGYLASGAIELSKDEAYQWLWSKHLALSYYSKPPGIALIQFAGTSLWGDTQFGVRFFSPVFAALLSFVLLRFLAREAGARLGFLVLLIVNCAPLLGVGAILMTIDPPLVLCWTLAMIAGWRAVQPAGTTKHWLLAGAATGLGFLSKYSALYLVVCWALFFVLWPPARVQLKRPGPYLALLVVALGTLPVILWNSQHGWITVQHVSENAALGATWKPTRNFLKFFWEFLGAEAGLLNPVFFIGALWAMAAFWPRRRQNPLWLYFFCLGAPVFLGHLAWSLHSRIQPNWIAPAVLPMFCLMALYWEARWREGARGVKCWLTAGLIFGLIALVFMHESNLIGRLAGRPLPAGVDPLRRVRAWKATSTVVERARQTLLREGKPTFIIADHYGMTGEFSFYLPEARASLGSGEPLVCCQTTLEPENQLYFWPEYQYRGRRRGQNAIYVTESEPDQPAKGWVWNWLTGTEIGYTEVPPPARPPVLIQQEFESVTDLGVHEIKLGDRVFRRVQLFACRDLR